MSILLRRREFIAGLGGAVAWPFATQAQQRALPVVGYVSVVSPEVATEREVAFRQGLGEAGYSRGGTWPSSIISWTASSTACRR